MFKVWPKGIYLESSVLCNLPIDVINAELERLKELAENLNVQVFIPEVSFREWVRRRKTSIGKHLAQVESGLENLSRLFDYVSRADWEKDKQEIIEDTENVTRKIVEDHGISIIATPDIDLKKLLDMSLDNIKPFEEGHEKGFRDAITLFTVLIHAKGQTGGTFVLVSNDKVYTHENIQQSAEEYDIGLVVVQSVSDCISEIEDLLKQAERWFDEFRENNLKKFLKKNLLQISEYIKEKGEFTQSFLKRQNKLDFASEIKKIEDIRVIDIDSAIRGSLPKGVSEGRIKISFVSNTEFDVTTTEHIPSPEPTVKYGQRVANPVFVDMFNAMESPPYRPIVTRSVQQPVNVTGSVFLKNGLDEKSPYAEDFSDLELEDILTRYAYSGEFDRSFRSIPAT